MLGNICHFFPLFRAINSSLISEGCVTLCVIVYYICIAVSCVQVNIFIFYKKDFSLSSAFSSACRIMANWLHGQPWDQASNLQVKREAPSTAYQT